MAKRPTAKSPTVLVVFAMFLTAVSAGLSCEQHESTGRPNFVLISIDTLRADHLGAYGYARETSPELDRFAVQGVRFERAIAPAPWTLPSHAGMLTGRHPHRLGIANIDGALPESVDTLAQSLSASGYQTAAYVDSSRGGFLGGERGFDRGFELFRHSPHGEGYHSKYDMASTVDAALGWLRARDAKRPFFLFLHTKSVHTAPVQESADLAVDAPYRSPAPFGNQFLSQGKPRFRWNAGRNYIGVKYLRQMNIQFGYGELAPPDFSEEQLAELIAMYDGGIRYVDSQFGRLMASLEELGLDDETVVVVTSDHGEAFLDHHFFLHREVFSGLTHVPLIVRDPRGPSAGRVVSQAVSLLDVAPTLLALADSPHAAALDGVPLPLEPAAEKQARELFSYACLKDDSLYEGYAIERGPFRLLYHRHRLWPSFRSELFRWTTDPKEVEPVEDQSELKDAMLKRLLAWIENGSEEEGSQIDIDDQTLEALRALGYVD